MLSTPLFALDHGLAWVEIPEPDQDPPTFRLVSEKYRCSATLSCQTVNSANVNVEELAQQLLAIRLEAESETMATAGRELSVDQSNKALPFGRQIEYFGSDSSGRLLRYFGVVAPTKVVNIYLETYDQSAEGLEAIFREMLQGLRM